MFLARMGMKLKFANVRSEIEAGNKMLAADLAKLRFCETENVKDWSLHADRVHVTDAEFSS
jgi:hypothetical protein